MIKHGIEKVLLLKKRRKTGQIFMPLGNQSFLSSPSCFKSKKIQAGMVSHNACHHIETWCEIWSMNTNPHCGKMAQF